MPLKYNVTVNCIHPGYTVTERMMRMFEREAQDSGATVDDVMARRTRDVPLGQAGPARGHRGGGRVLLLAPQPA